MCQRSARAVKGHHFSSAHQKLHAGSRVQEHLHSRSVSSEVVSAPKQQKCCILAACGVGSCMPSVSTRGVPPSRLPRCISPARSWEALWDRKIMTEATCKSMTHCISDVLCIPHSLRLLADCRASASHTWSRQFDEAHTVVSARDSRGTATRVASISERTAVGAQAFTAVKDAVSWRSRQGHATLLPPGLTSHQGASMHTLRSVPHRQAPEGRVTQCGITSLARSTGSFAPGFCTHARHLASAATITACSPRDCAAHRAHGCCPLPAFSHIRRAVVASGTLVSSLPTCGAQAACTAALCGKHCSPLSARTHVGPMAQ